MQDPSQMGAYDDSADNNEESLDKKALKKQKKQERHEKQAKALTRGWMQKSQ